MKSTMKILVMVALTLLAGTTTGDAFETAEETKAFSDKIVGLFVQEKFVEGLDLTKAHWPLKPVEIDGLANQIDQQWVMVRQRFGNATGMEYVKTERIGTSFIRHSYLHKFANHAIYWRIDYYKPTDEWIVNSIVFLDQLDELYE